MQILHCKIKERKKGKRKCTIGENSTLQNKRKKGKRKCTSGENSTLQNKEREKEMYIWCKLYIAK